MLGGTEIIAIGAVITTIGGAVALYRTYGNLVEANRRVQKLGERLSKVEESSEELVIKNAELTNEVARLKEQNERLDAGLQRTETQRGEATDELRRSLEANRGLVSTKVLSHL